MAQFEGFVSRQELVDFCRGRIPELAKQSDEYLHAINTAGDKLSNEDVIALNDAYSGNIGEQRAYRAICLWAGENLIPTETLIDMLDNEMSEELMEDENV